MKISVCRSLIEPQEIEVASRSTDGSYVVVSPTLYTDGLCDCLGYQFRHRCSHIDKVAEENVCVWGAEGWDYETCPVCGRAAFHIILPDDYR